jgi:predicted nucleic acid-binding Zn ribbon protein
MNRTPGRKRKCKEPVPVKDVLTALLRSAGLERAVRNQGVLLHWKDIVGEKVAAHAEPREIKDSVLFLKVENAAWRSQLFALTGDIQKKVNAYAGKNIVKKIYFL